MDVEQLRHTDISGINEELIPSPAGVCCCFIPEPLPGGADRESATIKGASLHVRQRQSAHVSNCIKQTSCILWLLLVLSCLSAALRRVSLKTHILKRTDGRQAALLGNLHLSFFFFFFTRFLIYTFS